MIRALFAELLRLGAGDPSMLRCLWAAARGGRLRRPASTVGGYASSDRQVSDLATPWTATSTPSSAASPPDPDATIVLRRRPDPGLSEKSPAHARCRHGHRLGLPWGGCSVCEPLV